MLETKRATEDGFSCADQTDPFCTFAEGVPLLSGHWPTVTSPQVVPCPIFLFPHHTLSHV